MIRSISNIAFEAGNILLKYYQNLAATEINNKSMVDFVSTADKESENYIIKELKKLLPESSILAEESGLEEHVSDYLWIIDPLDGTKNFIQGIPFFCVSIALYKDNEALMGIIYDPTHKELYSAEKYNGAFCNEKQLKVSNKSLYESLLATGFPFKNKHQIDDYLATFKLIFNNSVSMRRCGSAALDLCFVASGKLDGYWEIGISPWDIAAGALITEEAGGKISDFKGQNNSFKNSQIIASNSVNHQELLTLFKQTNLKDY